MRKAITYSRLSFAFAGEKSTLYSWVELILICGAMLNACLTHMKGLILVNKITFQS